VGAAQPRRYGQARDGRLSARGHRTRDGLQPQQPRPDDAGGVRQAP
jgi:hypothetical protein